MYQNALINVPLMTISLIHFPQPCLVLRAELREKPGGRPFIKEKIVFAAFSDIKGVFTALRIGFSKSSSKTSTFSEILNRSPPNFINILLIRL